jgi:hypothetical protein
MIKTVVMEQVIEQFETEPVFVSFGYKGYDRDKLIPETVIHFRTSYLAPGEGPSSEFKISLPGHISVSPSRRYRLTLELIK